MGWHQVINDYTDDYLIEQPAISLFYELGWETDFYEKFSKNSMLGRDATGKFVLRRRVRAILVGQNPDLLPKNYRAYRQRTHLQPAVAKTHLRRDGHGEY